MSQISRVANLKSANLLRSCFEKDGNKIKVNRRNDEWQIDINEGFIKALPLNEKIRGEKTFGVV